MAECKKCKGCLYCVDCDAEILEKNYSMSPPPTDTTLGVSTSLWSAALKAMKREHGDRVASARMELIRQFLAMAEDVYKKLEAPVRASK